MNTVRINIILPLEIAEKANLIKELTEGYNVRKKEDKELSLDWDATSGDGID